MTFSEIFYSFREFNILGLLPLVLIIMMFTILTLFQGEVISFGKPTTADKGKFTCESFEERTLLTVCTFDSKDLNVRF